MPTPRNAAWPPDSSLARLILCEPRGDWAAALRRELADSGLPMVETRSLADCWQALADWPASFVVIEASLANLERLLARLPGLARDYPSARFAVVAPPALAAHEWQLREAGAIHFACSTRLAGPLAQLAMRRLASLPPPPQTLTERIWESLPWGK